MESNLDNRKAEEEVKNLLPDPLVNDDQAIIANIKDKGLVIVTACSHAGIINTINYSKSLTGISKIYAIVGGFHLTGELKRGYHRINGQRTAECRSRLSYSLSWYWLEGNQQDH